MNLDAGLRRDRRALYHEGIDPLITEIIAVAKRHGFRRVVPYARIWTAKQVEEFIAAGGANGITVAPTCFSFTSSPGAESVVALPEILERDTFYPVFSSRHTPLDYYVHDKICFARWFEAGLRTAGNGLVRHIPTYTKLTVPPLNPDPRWPNLVIKFADFDKGQYVLMAKVRNEDEARAALGQDHPEAIPRAFQLNQRMRLANFLMRRGRLIYQGFIPPDIHADGLIRKLRLMMLVSPVTSQFLSIHGTESRPPEGPLAFGTVTHDSRLVISRSQGSPYCRLETGIEEESKVAAREIGRIIDHAIRAKFIVGPS